MNKIIFILLFHAMLCPPAFSQDGDTGFRHGKLENGLTYYVRHNLAPKGHADFYLVQNVGALMEEDTQNGLAHFLEHMAFNGSENFPRGVTSFLKRRGVNTFNAYTGQDETVYHINRVPTGERGLVDSCLLILRDWSGFLSLDPKEIDRERGVIFEERRSTRDVGKRVREQADTYIYNRSKYAVHDVIGTTDVLTNFTPEELRAYYQDFYRPDQQAVIIVGDIDVAMMEKAIQDLFNPIPKRINPKPRVVYEIPDNEEPLYCVSVDREIPLPTITVMKRVKSAHFTGLKEMMRANLLRNFFNKLVAKRLTMYVDMEDPSFTGTSVSYGNLVRGYDAFNIVLKPIMGKEREALSEIFREMELIYRFGFTEQELQAEINAYRKGLEETEVNQNKLSNDVYVTIYQNNFLKKKPLASVAEDIALSREILSELSVADLQDWMKAWNSDDKNLIFLLTGNDVSYNYPTQAEIFSLMREVRSAELSPRSYEIKAEPLVDFDIKGGKIVKSKVLKNLGAELWTLSNGCKVYYKHVTENKGMVGLLGESYGGKSVLKAEDLPSAEALNSLVLRSGLYKHSRQMIDAIMKGHKASVNLRLGETNESVQGQGDVEDVDLMFKMVYLLFEKPRFDRTDFDKFVALSLMENQTKQTSVMEGVDDAVNKIRMHDSPRRWKVDERFFKAMDYDKMTAIYADRFQDAADFTFYLVGDISKSTARDLVEQYLGAIPSIHRKESYQVYDFKKKGSLKEDVEAELPDEKYIVNVEYNNTLSLSPREEVLMSVLQTILQNRYNADIREEEGGTYGVSVESWTSIFPTSRQFLGVSFQTSLDKGERMRALVHKQVDLIRDMGIDEDEVSDVLLMMRKGMENRKLDQGISFWMEAIRAYVDEKRDITSSGYIEKSLTGINAETLRTFAQKFFGSADCIDIVVKSKK